VKLWQHLNPKDGVVTCEKMTDFLNGEDATLLMLKISKCRSHTRITQQDLSQLNM
jgi:hypothetical protein